MNQVADAAEPSPWHDGELALQRSVGAVEIMAGPGQRQMARTWMPDQHRDFYAQLPFIVLGTVDHHGEPWATIRCGQPGFLSSPNPETLHMAIAREPADPAESGINEGDAIGLLGIELHTRRRNRMNGIVRRQGDDSFAVTVSQAYGNCPRYINLRQFNFADEPVGGVSETTTLDTRARELISTADCFYVASYIVRDGARQVDVSHRGGKPGFVRIDEEGVLTIPDFSGNLFFNTLGNMLVNPRAGLTFIDFDSGDLLQMNGQAQIILDSPEIAAFQGVERLWRFTPQRIIRRQKAIPLRWTSVSDGDSPNSLMTGSWAQAAERLKAEALRDTWRWLRLVRVVDESQSIRSFYFESTDGAALPRFSAGQHLPLRLQLDGQKAPAIRTYSLSSAPSDDFVRISVKRDGSVSSHLHAHFKPGDTIEARAPQGHFTVDPTQRRPLVLIAAGVGVTPLLSMLREVIYEGRRINRIRPTWFVQSARSVADLAFGEEISELARLGGDKVRVLRLISQPETDAREGEGFELAGRIDLQVLKNLLPLDDYDFYLCGPGAFTQALYDGLRSLRIHDERIHAETFGPSTLVRDLETLVPAQQQVAKSSEPVKVLFSSSGKEARWMPDSGTLLQLAESRGLSPEFSCRGGSCGTCKTRLVSGQVHYLNMPAETLAEGEVLICCSVPAQGSETLVLEI